MGGHLLVSGDNVLNFFEDCQDSGFYISDETITLILVLPMEKLSVILLREGYKVCLASLLHNFYLGQVSSSSARLSGSNASCSWQRET